jgi:hypothetical protein
MHVFISFLIAFFLISQLLSFVSTFHNWSQAEDVLLNYKKDTSILTAEELSLTHSNKVIFRNWFILISFMLIAELTGFIYHITYL